MVPWPPLAAAVPPGDPEEFAVPALLVPGATGVFDALPAPDGSLPELFSPAAFAGPDGMLFTPWLPAPAAPAFCVPAAPGEPVEGPEAAPAPAPAAPPALAPPLPPPAPWV